MRAKRTRFAVLPMFSIGAFMLATLLGATSPVLTSPPPNPSAPCRSATHLLDPALAPLPADTPETATGRALQLLTDARPAHPLASAPPIQTPKPPTLTSVPATTLPKSPTPGLLPTTGPIIFQNPQRYRVEYTATVRNKGFTISKLLIYQPRPVAWDGQQEVTVEEISPAPSKQGTDPVFGNGIYYWNIRKPPGPAESLPIKLRFTYTAYEIATEIDPVDVRPYNRNDRLYKLYTRPERFIEATDPKIVELANQVAGGEKNPYRIARKFYDHVIATARYRTLGKGLQGAKTLVTTGQGECGDYSALFVALSRAKGIPARPVVGYWAVSGVEQTHLWAEFYLEGLGWIPVDPTFGQSRPGSPGKPDYYFGNMDNQRVILNKGYNIQLDPPGPDNFIAPFLQVPLWWYWGTGGDASTVSVDRTSWKVTPIR